MRLLILILIVLGLGVAVSGRTSTLIYQAQNSFLHESSAEILFVGDMMLDRNVRRVAEKQGFEYLIADVKSLFDDLDLTIGNLEGTITENESIAIKNNKILRFTFDPSVATSLLSLGFDGVSLANNHAYDFGEEGYEETINNLGEEGIFSFGSVLNNENQSRRVNIKDEYVCFVGYHELYNPNIDSTVREIQTIESECDFTIVLAHWGVEYSTKESKSQREKGYVFVDSGADLIIGTHPHVIQPIEIYKNKAIFYSLGNFIFDQDFSLETRQGLTVRLVLSDDRVTYKIIGIEMLKSKLYFPEENSFDDAMDVITSKLSAEHKKRVLFEGEFSLPR
ncbi:MAG: poly-gamma-glutamate synthesis protein (capsule biosynthesis protein) [Parcubacteria bacterium C7867-005]|nr:MAG: poly-gamma-glutamate synthesis protein (capsule biosynthesis protein) [Parcubacteria bacterium C7867-005]